MFPKGICIHCEKKLNDSYEFIQLCNESQNILNEVQEINLLTKEEISNISSAGEESFNERNEPHGKIKVLTLNLYRTNSYLQE